MQEEIVYIQNMDSVRDVLLVSKVLEEAGLQVKEVEIGTAAYINNSGVTNEYIKSALEGSGYQIMDPLDKEFKEKVRVLLSTYIDSSLQNANSLKLERYLASQLKMSYSAINHQYRMLTGQGIGEFYDRLRMERVKALLINAGMSLQDIADKLMFGTIRNLRKQFNVLTGQTIERYTSGNSNFKQNVAA
jgi:AraC-like DNA-binding protein